MLSAADFQLVRRDPHLPGLGTLLDAAAMQQVLQAQWPHQPISNVRCTYMRYKPGTSCLAAYRLHIGQADVLTYGKVYPPQQQAKLAKYQRLSGSTVGADLGGLSLSPTVLPDLGLAIAPFPADKQLKKLPSLFAESRRVELLQTLLPDHANLWSGQLETLHYKPERRYVGRLQGQQTSVALKAYTRGDYLKAWRNSLAVEAGGAVQTAPLLGYSHRYQMLAYGWQSATPLPQLLQTWPAAQLGPVMEQVGAALAALHAQPSLWTGCQSRQLAQAEVLALAADLSRLHPSQSAYIQRLGQQLTAQLAQHPYRPVAIHGDFKPEQVLVEPGLDLPHSLQPNSQPKSPILLDFDRADLGDRAQDLGSFLARLEQLAMTTDWPLSHYQTAADAFLTGYEAAGGELNQGAIALHTALGLYRIAIEPCRYRHPDWSSQMEQILQRAVTVLTQGPELQIPQSSA